MVSKQPKKRVVKPPETLRERAAKGSDLPQKRTRRIKKVASGATKPISKAGGIMKRDFYLPLPNNRLGKTLNKKRYIIPKFLRNAWSEVKLVTWPSRSETFKLTIAVFAFALAIGLFVAGTDYVLDKVFKEVLL